MRWTRPSSWTLSPASTCSASGRRPTSPRGCWPPTRTWSRSARSASAPTRSRWTLLPSTASRLQRAVLQHPLGRRARDRRHHRDGPTAHRARRSARRGLGQSPPGSHQVRGARSASSATATSARSSRWSPRCSACRSTSTTPTTSSPSGTPALLVAGRAARHRRDRHPARRRPCRERGIFGAAQFERMRPRSFFLNLSRGFVVDDHALRDAVVSGHIAGAAVDVFPVEPKSRGDAFDSPLRGPAQRDPHPARRRLHRGGAGGHRTLRRHQAPRLRHGRHRRCRSTCPR